MEHFCVLKMKERGVPEFLDSAGSSKTEMGKPSRRKNTLFSKCQYFQGELLLFELDQASLTKHNKIGVTFFCSLSGMTS